MYKAVIIGVLVLGLSLTAVAQRSQRISLMYGDYECSCSHHCPSYGITLGACYDDNNNLWGWGRPAKRCCIPSYMDDINGGYGDNGWGRGDNGWGGGDNGWGRGDNRWNRGDSNNGVYGGDFW